MPIRDSNLNGFNYLPTPQETTDEPDRWIDKRSEEGTLFAKVASISCHSDMVLSRSVALRDVHACMSKKRRRFVVDSMSACEVLAHFPDCAIDLNRFGSRCGCSPIRLSEDGQSL